MDKIKHWVIIRYNLGLYFTKGDAAQEWMKNRFKLFKNYTLKSLRNQTDKDFIVGMLFDAKTPAYDMEIIASEIDICACNFYKINWPEKDVPIPNKHGEIEVKKMDVYREKYIQFLNYSELISDIRDSSEYSIQTRLDNDDALMPNAIRSIQDSVPINKTDCAIDILNGYIVDVKNRKAYLAKHYFGTPFISLFQNNDKLIKCIYDCMHKKIMGNLQRISIDDRLWMMILHGGNVSNTTFDWMIEEQANYENLIP